MSIVLNVIFGILLHRQSSPNDLSLNAYSQCISLLKQADQSAHGVQNGGQIAENLYVITQCIYESDGILRGLNAQSKSRGADFSLLANALQARLGFPPLTDTNLKLNMTSFDEATSRLEVILHYLGGTSYSLKGWVNMKNNLDRLNKEITLWGIS